MSGTCDQVYETERSAVACRWIWTLLDDRRRQVLENLLKCDVGNANVRQTLILREWFPLGLLRETHPQEIAAFLRLFPSGAVEDALAKIRELALNFQSVYEESSGKALTNLRGRLKMAVDKKAGFLPFDLELGLAAMLRRMGAHVHLKEYNDKASLHIMGHETGETPDLTYDFSAVAEGGWEAQIDCKCILRDSGNDFSDDISDRLHPVFMRALLETRGNVPFQPTLIVAGLEEDRERIRSCSPRMEAEVAAAGQRMAAGENPVVVDGIVFRCFHADGLWERFRAERRGRAPEAIEDVIASYVLQTHRLCVESAYALDYARIDANFPVFCYVQRRSDRDDPGLLLQPNTLNGLKKAARRQLGDCANPFLAISVPDFSSEDSERHFFDGKGTPGCLPSTTSLASLLFGSERASHLAGVLFVGQSHYRDVPLVRADGSSLGQVTRRFDAMLNTNHPHYDRNFQFLRQHVRVRPCQPIRNPEFERYDLPPA